VNDFGPQLFDKRPEGAVFVQIAPLVNQHTRHRDAEGLQSGYEWVVIRVVGGEHCSDVHSVASLSLRKHRDDALNSTFSRGREQVKHANTLTQLGHLRFRVQENWVAPNYI
jgi:hypothetical protein